ncbi:hypothetical protein LV85_04314 [Algoriphagus chordae]|uniref:Uncharacterized protein n=1 Tax=Algoriphagus chordae TaxID=237019 RepID=A0A2W7QCN1_9BACT|nr:hypothetical protein LV85_04314 [Algoriphagus chordae]
MKSIIAVFFSESLSKYPIVIPGHQDQLKDFSREKFFLRALWQQLWVLSV